MEWEGSAALRTTGRRNVIAAVTPKVEVMIEPRRPRRRPEGKAETMFDERRVLLRRKGASALHLADRPDRDRRARAAGILRPRAHARLNQEGRSAHGGPPRWLGLRAGYLWCRLPNPCRLDDVPTEVVNG
jgi:hypothetical protein